MITPPGLLGLGLLFWGWMIGALWLAAPLAVLLESSRWIRLRFDFSQSDLDRIWHLCILLFVGAAVAAFALGDGFNALSGVVANSNPAQRLEMFNQSANTAVQFLQYSPATMLPIMLAQAFAQERCFAGSTFSWWLRRRRRLGLHPTPERGAVQGINVTYPFLAVTLFAAALSRGRGPWFLPGLSFILIWALWHHRPRGASLRAWGAALTIAVALGIVAQYGLIELQKGFRRLDAALMSQFSGGGKGYDPRGTRTRLGSIGGLKQSGQIILRIEAAHPPPLLREASYDIFRAPLWGSTHRQFYPTLPDAVDSSWPLLPATTNTAKSQPSDVIISTYLDGGRGLLPLPTGVTRLTDLPVFLLQTNGHGAVQVEEGPGFVRFNARYCDERTFDSPPTSDDRIVPQEERVAVEKVATELALGGLTPASAIARIRKHFADRFEYATWQGADHRPNSNRTALAAFLLEHRSGHCEYFATATALLLRAAGIPARYAVGYAVQEKSGRYHLVRNRHAHAWALAWVDGRWLDVDTTPGSWIALESQRAGLWEPVYDLFSRVWFEFSKWRWGPTEWKRHLIWLIVPLVVLVAVRVLWQRQWRRVALNSAGRKHGPAPAGLDSEFYRIEGHLRERGLAREPSETMAGWIQRARRQIPEAAELFQNLLDLHYRLRFDPQGLSGEERSTLRTQTEHWLARELQAAG